MAEIVVEKLFDDHDETINRNGFFINASIPYVVVGAKDEGAALGAVFRSAPRYYKGMRMSEIATVNRLREDTWKISVPYASPNGDHGDSATGAENERKITETFSTLGGSEKILRSLGTVKSFGKDPPDFHGLINVDSQGNVGGAERYVSRISFTRTEWMKYSRFSRTVKKKYSDLACSVNADNYLGYEPGEVLYLGCEANASGTDAQDIVQIAHKFLVSPNIKGYKVGKFLINAKGWELLWSRNKQQFVGESVNVVVEFAKVEKIYQYQSFKGLAT